MSDLDFLHVIDQIANNSLGTEKRINRKTMKIKDLTNFSYSDYFSNFFGVKLSVVSRKAFVVENQKKPNYSIIFLNHSIPSFIAFIKKIFGNFNKLGTAQVGAPLKVKQTKFLNMQRDFRAEKIVSLFLNYWEKSIPEDQRVRKRSHSRLGKKFSFKENLKKRKKTGNFSKKN